MKKLFVIGLVVAMGAMSLGAVLAVPAQAASAGDLIKMAGNPAVYYLGSNNKRFVFPNANAFFTWYDDFSSVKTISKTELESYSLGGNVTYRPGTHLVKVTTNPKVYAVEPGAKLRWVNSEATMSALYGSQWTKKIDDVPDPFWVNYTEGSDITSATYPTGSLVKESGSATVYYIDGSTKRPVTDAGMTGNRFNNAHVVTASSLASYTAGTSITAYESAIAAVDGSTAAPTTSSTGTLTVALASDTPASGTVVAGATNVKFTKVNLSATGGDVVIDSLQIKRLGLAQDENFSNVYVLDSAGSMHDNEKTLSSTHTAYITKDMTIANGTTKTIYLAATMAASATINSGEVASLGISEVNVKGNATVIGTLPIGGNAMTMNSTISIGTVTPTDGGLATTATKPVGTANYTFSSVKLTVNSIEDVQLEKIRFYQSGTAADSDLANLKLLMDGATLATVSQPTDKYVDFDLSSAPVSITKGQNKTFELKGDIINGSSRTIDFEVYNKADILVKGKTYGFYINPAYTATSAPYWTNAYPTTVSTGTLTVSKATLSSTNIAEGGQQQNLGAFFFNAQGENIIITQMIMEVTTSTSPTTGEITNLTVYDESGAVIAGPQDKVDAATDTVTFTDTFTVPSGIHKYTVKGDLDSNFSAEATVRMDFNTPDAKITAKGETTNNTVTPAPTTEITSDTMTIKTADLNVSTSASPAAQTVAKGTTAFVFANFVLDASQSGEDIKVTQMAIKHSSSAANIHDNITGITLYDGATALNTPVSGEGSTTVSAATSTITLTNPLIISKGSAKTIVLKGDVSGSAATDSTHQFGLQTANSIVSYGVSTGNSVTEDVTDSLGQTMTVTAGGTLRLSNSGSNPATGLVIADSTNVMGVFNAEALYENIEVQKFGFTISSGDDDNIAWLQLYDGSTKLGEIQVTGVNATITPSSTFTINQNTNKTLTLKAITQRVGVLESGDSGDSIVITLTGMDVKGASTGSTALTKSGLDSVASNTQYIYKTKPTVTKVSLSGMANGTQDLFKFTLAADSKGDVGFYKASFMVTTSTATITNFKMYEIDGSAETDVSYTAYVIGEVYTDSGGDGIGGVYVIDGVVDTSGMAGAKEYRTVGAGSSKTFVFRGDVTSWVSNSTLQVQLMGDEAVATLSSTDTIEGLASDNFVWSDLFYGYSSTSATETLEWTNGYKVFATSSQSF